MEDVLTVYERPYDPAHPVVCLDETSRQLLGDVRPPMLGAPGRPARRDPAYVRGGVVNLFLATEPLRGWRTVLVSDQRLAHRDAMDQEVTAWADRRNTSRSSIDRQFTTADARIKLRRLYPAIDP